ncbi:hypothetical protein Ancab_027342 [Ancistrocladus abbreviatus]
MGYHPIFLKSYPEDEAGFLSSEKPVVVELYDEMVFPEPSDSFVARAAVNKPGLPAGVNSPPPGVLCCCFVLKIISAVFLGGTLTSPWRQCQFEDIVKIKQW